MKHAVGITNDNCLSAKPTSKITTKEENFLNNLVSLSNQERLISKSLIEKQNNLSENFSTETIQGLFI